MPLDVPGAGALYYGLRCQQVTFRQTVRDIKRRQLTCQTCQRPLPTTALWADFRISAEPASNKNPTATVHYYTRYRAAVEIAHLPASPAYPLS